ncbi:MAG: 4,5-dihydroxyphthalate decarboxylase [Pseudomonadota bacterium]|nr:4,5-dihydroxyphthalate decarboxylase [Pseudomonadota bacterium]
MSELTLTFAASDYEHTRDLTRGDIQAEGIDLRYLNLQIEETFFRFIKFREWDVSEMSFGKYIALKSQNDQSLTAIPVFPSRVFRQSSLFVVSGSNLQEASDLRGKRIGIPEWAQTASIYTRGWLAHDIGIPLQEIEWIQGGVNDAGRQEKVTLNLPDGVSSTPRPDRSLTEMLLGGEIDCIMSAHPPAPVENADGSILHLYPNYREIEEQYYRDTGIFPIMHVIALRGDVFEQNRWIAKNLLKAFTEAKDRAMLRVQEMTATRVPFAWCYEGAQKARRLFGEDFFPYGVEANRKTLEAFLRYGFEQGVCQRKVEVEELFPEEVQAEFRV